MSYAKALQEFPFKGAETNLKRMEEHELISVSYIEGRAESIRPGKPVFRYAFQALIEGQSRHIPRLHFFPFSSCLLLHTSSLLPQQCRGKRNKEDAHILDPIFRASSQIEYNTVLINKAESDIKAVEAELLELQTISSPHKSGSNSEDLAADAGGFFGSSRKYPIRQRMGYLLDKMNKAVEKLVDLEKENKEMMKILSTGKA